MKLEGTILDSLVDPLELLSRSMAGLLERPPLRTTSERIPNLLPGDPHRRNWDLVVVFPDSIYRSIHVFPLTVFSLRVELPEQHLTPDAVVVPEVKCVATLIASLREAPGSDTNDSASDDLG